MLYRKLTLKRMLAGLCLVILLAPEFDALASGLNIVSSYSPHTRTRARRASTKFIVLHTTEGGLSGSLKKLKKNGEAHYLVDYSGKVYRVVERSKVAYHSGRSMWQGQTNLDKVSIGIEIVGYHNKPPNHAQKKAVKELCRQLQKIYRIPDSRVIPHSMVAYGKPNRWHRKAHRGRKRCAMLYGQTTLRREIGLTSKPTFDPDVRAGRLVNADPYLTKVLFGPEPKRKKTVAKPTPKPTAKPKVPSGTRGSDGILIPRGKTAWDVAREQYKSRSTVYVFPNGTRMRGDQIRNWGAIPRGTRVIIGGNSSSRPTKIPATSPSGSGIGELGKHGSSAQAIAGSAYNRSTTLYVYPDGRVRSGHTLTNADFRTLPKGCCILKGFRYRGKLSRGKTAYDLAGARWNAAGTLYRLPDGSFKTGDKVNARSIPANAMIFTEH